MDVARQAEMLANRVRKTWRRLHPRFSRQNIGAFRLYDRDIPEIRAVVDWYEGHLVIGEYARTQTDEIPGWLESMARAVANALEVPAQRLHLKRRRTRPADHYRYPRGPRSNARLEVSEGDLRFWTNLDDAIDTGLFIDHRDTRARLRAESSGARFLNLYGYTGSFTVAAAAGGAVESHTVDVSRRYLTWAQDNLELNRLASPRHRLIQADARDFLRDARRASRSWTLAVVDPPSFSDRGGANKALDLQEQHPEILAETLAVLAPGGVLYFSTNHQRFVPRLDGLAAAACVEITRSTVPEDFRNRAVHRAWRLVR